MLHSEVNINNYAKNLRDCIPKNTHKFLTQEIKTLNERISEIDKILHDRTSKVDPEENSQLRQEQEVLSERIEEHTKLLKLRQKVIQVIEQEERCLPGNAIDLLMGPLQTPKTVYYDVVVTCKDTISVDSPIGRVIFGKPVGTTIQFYNPVSQQNIEVVIQKITSHEKSKKLFFKKNKKEREEEREDGMLKLQAS